MDAIVEHVERVLLARFRALAEDLSARFPHVSASVDSSPVGSLTSYQGHALVIDCLLRDVPASQPDNVALSVELRHLSTGPQLNADVCWGHPSGYVEAEFSGAPAAVSAKVLNDLYDDLPRLYASLVKAVERGKPSAWHERPA